MLAGLIALTLFTTPHEAKWKTLFNGKDLSGWTAKVKGYALGENFGDTFRVADGTIQVRYDKYGGKFEDRFGHLFYKTPYSNYILQVEYQFSGEQLPDGPGWAFRNSGVMIHGQDPKTMRLDQDFPVSSEVQLLGNRSTANVCTPGTNIVMDGKLRTQHCFDSSSPSFMGDVWVKAEVEVHGHGLVIHRVEGKEVLRYEKIQLDPNDRDGKALIKDGKLEIGKGTISLQSESHPVSFRNIRIQVLEK